MSENAVSAEELHADRSRMHISDTDVAVEIIGMHKWYGDFHVLKDINLKVMRGERIVIAGPSGSGKSTMIRCINRLEEHQKGKIIVDGNELTNDLKKIDEVRREVGMVFQHFSLFEALTAAENIALSLDTETPIATIAERARDVSQAYGLPLDPYSLVGDLSVGERQRIEIIRCLLQEPQLIILDEPTSVLTPQEADKLFETLERLRSEGKSILYISHRLEEVKRLCDRATVLRHGKVVNHCDPQKETASSLASMMVGSEVGAVVREDHDVSTGEPLLEIRGLTRPRQGPFSIPLQDIWLNVRAGEVLGIAGVAGNGQGEFFEAVSGEARQRAAGEVRICGKDAGHMGISERRLIGAAFVPEERLGHGAAPQLKLSENLLLSRHRTDKTSYVGLGGVIRSGVLSTAAKRIVEGMDVRKSGEDPEAAALSGGNLQKFIIGRELDRSPSVMIVNQPTWGVDAGAAARIRQSLIDLARAGSAVLVISQDLDELFEVSDAIAVMHDGKLSQPIPIADATFEKIGLLMGGAHGMESAHGEGVA